MRKGDKFRYVGGPDRDQGIWTPDFVGRTGTIQGVDDDKDYIVEWDGYPGLAIVMKENAELIPPEPQPCPLPPPGWACTRGAGHKGPCAAVPVVPASTSELWGVWDSTTGFWAVAPGSRRLCVWEGYGFAAGFVESVPRFKADHFSLRRLQPGSLAPAPPGYPRGLEAPPARPAPPAPAPGGSPTAEDLAMC